MFVELEVVRGGQDTIDHGERIARQLVEDLGIQEGDLIEGAYIDLLSHIALERGRAWPE